MGIKNRRASGTQDAASDAGEGCERGSSLAVCHDQRHELEAADPSFRRFDGNALCGSPPRSGRSSGTYRLGTYGNVTDVMTDLSSMNMTEQSAQKPGG